MSKKVLKMGVKWKKMCFKKIDFLFYTYKGSNLRFNFFTYEVSLFGPKTFSSTPESPLCIYIQEHRGPTGL